ncbi:MAG TPA: LuxR C-terminal-related transcriptional regulator [Ktedonobacteraceae bacterium]|nr:LuxR C-terminal-related transcriptional regulator [Ktedonobacteraceae bacterium]
MPKSAQNVVYWSREQEKYLLTEKSNGTAISALGGENWLHWLEEHRSFSFRGRIGQINMLKEKRSRGGDYWYAYQRQGKEMLKRYAGRSEQLSMERLEEIASLLAMEEGAMKMEFPNAPVEVEAESGFEALLMPKLQLPRIQKSLLKRERLLHVLDKSLDYGVTVISGPAGYGKTSAVVQWITERSSHQDFPRVVYIALDDGDNDPFLFWRYVIAACQKLQTGFGKEALDLLLTYRLSSSKPLNMMLTSLLNELSQLEQSCILILDDFHVINSQQVRETLNFFLDHLPTSFHLFLLIRGEPSLSLTRMRARNELFDIYPPYLGFSLEETRAFFEQELSVTLSTKMVRQIFERLEGWPAGMRLLASLMRRVKSEQEVERMLSTFTGSLGGIRDYFFHEVWSTLEEELQQFLLQTSILPLLIAELCDAVLQRENSLKLLEALSNGDLFAIRVDVTGKWRRYQGLFAEAMQEEARKQLGEERLRRVAAEASLWYEQNGYHIEAIETALNASAFTRAANLIQIYVENKQPGNLQTIAPAIPEFYDLKRWLERLPEDELERKPDLCLQYAMVLLYMLMENPRVTERKERIYQLLQIAEQKWRDENTMAKLAEVFSFRSLMARQEGRMLEAVTWARQALVWLPPENRTWRTIALTVVGFGETLDGNLKDARKYLLEALTLNEQQGNIVNARANRGMLAWVSIEQGELRQASEQYRQMQAEARLQDDYDDIAHTQLGLAQIAYQWNNLDEARNATQEALEVGERMDTEEFQALATARLALIEHAQGQTVQARQRLLAWLAANTTPITPHSYQLYREVQATLARLYLASGDLLSVERWFESIELRDEVLPLLQRQREQLLKVCLLLAQGETDIATKQLEQLSAAARHTGHFNLQREVQVVLALTYFHGERDKEGQQQLLELLAAARSENYLRLYLDQGEEIIGHVRELLPQISEKTVLAYARRILDAFDRKTGTPEFKTQAFGTDLLEPLSAQEQKVLRLLAAGNSNAEIAREQVVSVNTIRTQVQSIYRKLNVNNRVEASEVARKLGWA